MGEHHGRHASVSDQRHHHLDGRQQAARKGSSVLGTDQPVSRRRQATDSETASRHHYVERASVIAEQTVPLVIP
jgi:hypothetical protein